MTQVSPSAAIVEAVLGRERLADGETGLDSLCEIFHGHL
jgi:hypothetical protein